MLDYVLAVSTIEFRLTLLLFLAGPALGLAGGCELGGCGLGLGYGKGLAVAAAPVAVAAVPAISSYR